jgi:hypothetical protein
MEISSEEDYGPAQATTKVRLTLSFESCGMAQTPSNLGGTVISHTPNSSFFIGCEVLFHSSIVFKYHEIKDASRDAKRNNLTEIANQIRLFGVRSPLPIHDLAIISYIETKLEISFGEEIESSLKLLDGIFPLSIHFMAVQDGGDIGFKITVEFQDSLGVKRGRWHSLKVMF